jgi:hypothetical protein
MPKIVKICGTILASLLFPPLILLCLGNRIENANPIHRKGERKEKKPRNPVTLEWRRWKKMKKKMKKRRRKNKPRWPWWRKLG